MTVPRFIGNPRSEEIPLQATQQSLSSAILAMPLSPLPSTRIDHDEITGNGAETDSSVNDTSENRNGDESELSNPSRSRNGQTAARRQISVTVPLCEIASAATEFASARLPAYRFSQLPPPPRVRRNSVLNSPSRLE